MVSKAIAKYVKGSPQKTRIVVDAIRGKMVEDAVAILDAEGFDLSSAANQGYGLDSMRERADNVFGTFTIESGHGNGTKVIVRIPITELEV